MSRAEQEVQQRQPQITDEEAAEVERRVKHLARTDPFLVVCRCFSLITVVCALMCVVVNVFSAIRSFKDGADIFDGILRCFAVIIALIVVVAETEWERILKFWLVLEYCVGRGMLQIFVAVMTKALSTASEKNQVLTLFQEIASYMLLACGVVYVIAGILCCGILKRARLKKAITKEQAHKDLEELEKRREELRRALLNGD
uniref:TSA: Wollemia nobilis Ref_Wollemi_Transcript_13822_1127 transcribed RNA sequence n=1 Tax=Wollemia nobilis TaxID=56998 RepID=A0A0C9RKE3_9CONI